MELLSLSPVRDSPKLNLTPEPVVTRDPQETIRTAERYDYAMGSYSPGFDQLVQSINGMAESSMRRSLQMSVDLQKRTDEMRKAAEISRTAAQQQRMMSPEEEAAVLEAARPEQGDPETSIERMYSEEYLKGFEDIYRPDLAPEGGYSEWEEGLFVSKTNIARRILDETSSKLGDQNWLLTGAQFVAGVVPFVSWSNTQSRIEGESRLLQGQNTADQIRNLYLTSKSSEEFNDRLQTAVDEIAEFSLLDAQLFAAAAVSYPASDEALDNLFSVLDVFDVGIVSGAVAVGRLNRINDTRVRTATAAQAEAHPSVTQTTRLVTQGKIEEASEVAALERLSAVTDVVETPRAEQRLEELMESGVSLLDANRLRKDSGTLSNERTNRIVESLTETNAVLLSTLSEGPVIKRTSDAAAQALFKQTEDTFRVQNFAQEDFIVDVRYVRESAETYTGVDRIEVLFGTKDAGGFTKSTDAYFHADEILNLLPKSYDVISDSGNFFVRVIKNVDETDSAMQGLRIKSGYAVPKTFTSTWLGFAKTADGILGPAHASLRKFATYGGNATLNRLAEAAKAIGKLSKSETRRLREILDNGRLRKRTVKDPLGKDVKVRGMFYETIGDLEKEYLRRYKTLPTDREIESYFTFRYIMDLDYIQKNLSVYRDLARQGIEQHVISASVQKTAKSQYRMTELPAFDGKVVDSLPASEHTVMWINDKNKVSFGLSSRMHGGQRKSLEAALSQGRIIQVLDDAPLRKYSKSGGEPVQFVVAKSKTKPLSTRRVAHNEGGHWAYPSGDVYMKQPKTHRTGQGRRVYTGDVTAHSFPARLAGQKMTNNYNKARILLKEAKEGGDVTELAAFVDANLPYKNVKAFARLFADKGPFDIDTPFVLTKSGERAGDALKLEEAFGGPVVDLQNSEHSLSRKVNAQYTQERGEMLTQITQTGTEANPIYSLRPAQMIDSLETLRRSAATIAKNRMFDDYRHASIENWGAQFADVIDAPRPKVLADPMRYITDPVWKDGADLSLLHAAKASRRAILNLLGVEGVEGQIFQHVRQKAMDITFKAGGEQAVKIIEPRLWRTAEDATTLGRSIVFHAFLGMLNPVQTLLQGFAASNAIAIDGNPVRAMRAVMSATNLRRRDLLDGNTKYLRLYNEKFEKAVGVPKSVQEEMYKAWVDSGFDKIDGAYARLDNYLNEKDFMDVSGGRRALDFGTVFFRAGNSIHRDTAFTLAFLRWRDKNPTARLTNKALQSIVDRADMGYQNMGIASNALWQKGLMSIPSQFLSYGHRLSSQLLGKDLTPWEKARLLSVNSLLWGVPTGGAAAIGGFVWPVDDSLKQAALEHGIDPNGGIAEVVWDGVASVAVETLTGTEFDVGGRFGPGGFSWLKDLLEGNTFDALGASPNFFVDAFKTAEPFTRALYATFYPESGEYNIQQQDFINVFRNISTVNLGYRAYYIHTAGEWLTKSGTLVSDSLPDQDPAVTIAVALGLTPREVSDAYLLMNSNKDFRDARRSMEREVLREFELGLKAAQSNNETQMNDYFQRAQTLMIAGGLTPMERGRLFQRALQGNKPMIETIWETFSAGDPFNEERRTWATQQAEDRLLQRQENRSE